MTTAQAAGKLLLPLLLLPLLTACVDEGGDTPDPTGQKGCPGNVNVEPGAAIDLAAGQTAQGYLCPVGNQHWYRITVPAGDQVVSVDLHNDTPVSPVKLNYALRGSDGMMAIDQAPPPAQVGNVKQSLRYSHCVPQPGTYYLQVRSFSDDGADTRNPFTLSYTTAKNPDPGKPGNATPQGAIALTGAPVSGYVACKGDQSYYKLTVSDGQLLDISLTTAAPTPALSLKYTLLDDQMGYVADDAAPSGMAATKLNVVRVAPKAGTYFLRVSDQGDGSDLKTPYSLKVSTFTEPDSNERPTRNDAPATATAIGSFACGGTATLQAQGYLASRADVDWYKLTLTGISPTCAATLEADAGWGTGGQALRPQISLIYPDMNNADMTQNTACVKDEDCRVLKRACGTDDNRCEYFGHQCNKQEGKCTGASVCLPEKFCGVAQYAKNQLDSGTPAAVRTSQPLTQSGVYYLRVRDFQSQGYDPATRYTLKVRVITDTNEPNNFYNPYAAPFPDNALIRNPTFITKNKITLAKTVTGRIGYERDQDFYVLDHPCPGADCTLKVTYSSSASKVYYTYQIEGDGRLLGGWPAAPMPRLATAPAVSNAVYGDGVNTCFYASKKVTGPFYLWVSDLLLSGGPLWDLDGTYALTVEKVQDGCSNLCKQAPFNCGL